MRFKDAAFKILKENGGTLHYDAITDMALEQGLLDTQGQTPHATMGALLYTDTLNPISRFRRGEQRGTFGLKITAPAGIEQEIAQIGKKVRQDLRNRLLRMPPQQFEELIRALLEEMGFDETETTQFANDRGIDVRGLLKTNQLAPVRVVIQAKRWANNVGAVIVRNLRGSMRLDGEQGIIVTPSDFTAEAKRAAHAPGMIPITLINGERLIELLFEYQVGVKEQSYIVHSIDSEFWGEILGVDPDITPAEQPAPRTNPYPIHYPLEIRAQYHGQEFSGQLLNQQGSIRFNGRDYVTASAAAKAIAVEWREANGWRFWKYLNAESGEWEHISSIRQL
jgi:restriction system protein